MFLPRWAVAKLQQRPGTPSTSITVQLEDPDCCSSHRTPGLWAKQHGNIYILALSLCAYGNMLHVCTTCNATSYKSCSSTSLVICSAQRVHSSDRAAMCISTEQQCSLRRSHFNTDWQSTSAPTGAIFQYNFTLVLKSPAVILVQPTQNSTEDPKHDLKSRHFLSPQD